MHHLSGNTRCCATVRSPASHVVRASATRPCQRFVAAYVCHLRRPAPLYAGTGRYCPRFVFRHTQEPCMPMLPLPLTRTTSATTRPLPSMLTTALLLVLSAGAVAPVAAQQAAGGDATQTLDSVVVTGSRLRRVDTETANPVVTVSQEQIAATGKATVGDLLQELPSIAGNATNPYTNNGGGTGARRSAARPGRQAHAGAGQWYPPGLQRRQRHSFQHDRTHRGAQRRCVCGVRLRCDRWCGQLHPAFALRRRAVQQRLRHQ